MQEHTYEELNQRAKDMLTREAEALFAGRAEVAVRGELEAMRIEDKVLLMSDEEERMIRSFRRFKSRMRKDGEVFKWQTAREPGVLISQETGLVADPQEVA